MLVLTSSDVLQVVTSSANAVDAISCYSDTTTALFTPGRQSATIAAATTTPLISAPAAGTQRNVTNVRIFARGGANTLTIRYNTGSNFDLGTFALASGETLEYENGAGWRVLDAAGQLKTNVSGAGRFLRQTLVTATASPFALLAATTSVRVRLCGGGGGGGGVPVNAVNAASAGSGGNAGGVVDFFTAQTVSFVFAIGAAGTTGAGAAGGAGGNTTATVGGVALSATGGNGGGVGVTGAVNAQVAPGASVTGSGAGAQLINGQRGDAGQVIQTGAAAATIKAIGGAGANSEFGSGGPAVQAGAAAAAAAGSAAVGFGAGGGGAASGSGGATQAGGAAAGGWMIVWEYS